MNKPATGFYGNLPALNPATRGVDLEQPAGGLVAGDLIAGASASTQYVGVTPGEASGASPGFGGKPTLVRGEEKLDLAATVNWFRKPSAEMPRLYQGGISDPDVADIAIYLQQCQRER